MPPKKDASKARKATKAEHGEKPAVRRTTRNTKKLDQPDSAAEGS